MPTWKRPLSRLILLSFALRALVPLGLMLQLPVAGATENGKQLAFVICPQQNPGLDLTQLADSSQVAGAHAHHGHHNHVSDPLSGDSNGATITVDQSGSLCNLWSSSADANFVTVADISNTLARAAQRILPTSTVQFFSNQYPTRLTRAPPASLC